MSAPTEHQVNSVAGGIRQAARDIGVEVPAEFACRVATDGLGRDGQLGVTRLGIGIVIHTVPTSPTCLPIVVGYADAGGQWYRDGTRHGLLPPKQDIGTDATDNGNEVPGGLPR